MANVVSSSWSLYEMSTVPPGEKSRAKIFGMRVWKAKLAAGLIAVATLPLVAGITGSAALEPHVFSAGFRTAMWVVSTLVAAAGVLSYVTIRRDERPAMTTNPRVDWAARAPDSNLQSGVSQNWV